MSSFWNEIDGPIMALAPMEDVTDTVFREIIASVSEPGAVHLFMTEFISTDGMMHEVGRDRVIHRLYISDTERALLKEKNIKLVAQIWGNNPDNYSKAVKDITENMDFDGIDINMGCPVNKVVKKGCCSGLIETPELAKELVLAAKEATHLPVSVKTRTGIRQPVTEEWINHLLETKPAAITLPGRTQRQMSEGWASWEEISKAARCRDASGQDIPVVGNGDLTSYQEIVEKCEKYQVDGGMVGRGIFNNPWLFNSGPIEKTPKERMRLLWRHAQLFWETWGDRKNFQILRRFFKIYAANFHQSAALRSRLMSTRGMEDVEEILKEFDII